jgi:hypothetical protein
MNLYRFLRTVTAKCYAGETQCESRIPAVEANL